MSKVQTLRAFVEQRLTAAAEEILELFGRTVAEFEEELCRQRKTLEEVLKPEVVFHRADMTDVVALITTVLPNCKVQSLLDTLESIGVSSLEDLGFVEPDDLEGVLKKVESRKLLARAKAQFSPAGHESLLSSPAGFSSSQATPRIQPCVKAFGCSPALSGSSGAGFEDGTLPNSPESSQSAPRISTSTSTDVKVTNLTASSSNSDALPSTLDPDWHFNFCIPWNSMPSHIKETLEKQERPSARDRREVVRMVTAEILAVCKYPQKKHLREIARKMVLAYPKSFKDVIEGQVVGSGYDSLTRWLQCRVDNCKRAQLVISPNSSGRKRRRQKNVNRCVNPDLLPGKLEVEQQNKEELQRMFEEDEKDENKIKMLMTETFASQRRDVLCGNHTQTLKEEWPFLFHTTGLKTHFRQLTGVHINEEFKETMSRKSRQILQYLKKRDRGSSTVKLLCDVQSAGTGEELYHAVRMLLLHFKEDESKICVQVEDACMSAEVRRDDLPPNPCIVVCGDAPLTTGEFMVAVDQMVVMERISTFTDAMASMFMMYYVMNIDYPAEVCATLEFLQRCIFRINSDNGSTAGNQEKRKRFAVNPKVLTLISNLSEND
ncbi:uncharacterized protein LOC119010651 isoform X2 [Acanthopagrus latus]|uniref:uncharacterized protein LOC119010651 isoform X2 n=1 Tax=Acanthopagrus latus TaxID=8177 RepID=UPI00187BEBCC|nr:uncharacterized protein LOC119010651 isoform X2 [Acanthopagrus latus]